MQPRARNYFRPEWIRAECNKPRSNSFNYRSNRSPSALTRDHSGRGAIRRITPMRRLSLFLRYPLPAPHPSCSHPFSPPSLSCLFLCLSRLFALADCVPTFLRSLFVSLSFSPVREHERAIARVGVRGRASLFLSHDSPPLISPLGPPRRALSQRDIANSCVSSRRADFYRSTTTRSFKLRKLRLRGGYIPMGCFENHFANM